MCVYIYIYIYIYVYIVFTHFLYLSCSFWNEFWRKIQNQETDIYSKITRRERETRYRTYDEREQKFEKKKKR